MHVNYSIWVCVGASDNDPTQGLHTLNSGRARVWTVRLGVSHSHLVLAGCDNCSRRRRVSCELYWRPSEGVKAIRTRPAGPVPLRVGYSLVKRRSFMTNYRYDTSSQTIRRHPIREFYAEKHSGTPAWSSKEDTVVPGRENPAPLYGTRITPAPVAYHQRLILLLCIIIFLAHQHKAAGRQTRLDIQNYGCNGNLLCYHGVVERNRISSLQSHGKSLLLLLLLYFIMP